MAEEARSRNRFAGIVLLAPILVAGAVLRRELQQDRSPQTLKPAQTDSVRPAFTIATAQPADGPFALEAQPVMDIMGQRLLAFTVGVTPHGNSALSATLADLSKPQNMFKPGIRTSDSGRVAPYFRMTIQPLDADGQPIAPPSPLSLSPLMIGGPAVAQQKLSGQMPVNYPPHTRQIALDLEYLQDPAVHGHWILKDLPKTQTVLDTQSPPITRAGAPGIVLEGVAAIVPDIDPNSDPKLTRPHRSANGVTSYLQYPYDYHQTTGLPAIQLALRAASPNPTRNKSFVIGIDDVKSDWLPIASTPPAFRAGQPSRVFVHVIPQPEVFQMYCGPAYTKSLKRLRVSGRISERMYRFEHVTLPAADAVYDPDLHRYDVRWKSPTTATTPSGAKVIALNPWRRMPHARRILRPAQPQAAVASYAYVTIAWLPPKQPTGSFALSDTTPVLANPLSALASAKPVLTQPAFPAPATQYAPPTEPFINGNTSAGGSSPPTVTDYCLPGSDPVGGEGQRLSPSIKDLNNSDYKIIRFAIPITVSMDSKSYPPIHFDALRFEANGDMEIRQSPFLLNLPFSKLIPPSWIPAPTLIQEIDPVRQGGFPEAVNVNSSHPTHVGERSTAFKSKMAPPGQ